MSELRDAMRGMQDIRLDAGLPPCAACTQSVHAHDAVEAFGRPYHRSCLACQRCRAALQQGQFSEHRGGPVCLDCSAFYQGKKCDRCGEGAAHAVSALGRRFHKSCFTCATW